MKQMTHKEIEQENINIEKQAYALSHCTTDIDYKTIKQRNDEDLRLYKAENEDTYERIDELEDSRPAIKTTNLNKYITAPTIATGVIGGLIAAGLIHTGALEPTYMANDINDKIGVMCAGFGTGGFVGLINSICNCARPLTNAVIKFKIKKELEQIEYNNRKIRAIEYLQKCLKKEEESMAKQEVYEGEQMDLFEQEKEEEENQMTLFHE